MGLTLELEAVDEAARQVMAERALDVPMPHGIPETVETVMVPASLYHEILTKYGELVQEVIKLKREGYVSPGEVPPAPELPELEDQIMDSIGQITNENSVLHRELLAYAGQRKASGVHAEIIAAEIRDGGDPF